MLALDADTVVRLFERLQVWKKNGERAPNKSLLVLWAIGRCLSGQPRLVSFEVVDHEVSELLRQFGPPRKRLHPEYAFWRLQNDRIWEVAGANHVTLTRSGDPSRQDLIDRGVQGGFLDSIHVALRADEMLCARIARSLVQSHFPLTFHEDILEAAGIRSQLIHAPGAEPYVRDPRFRRAVLKAYDFGCALCGFAVRFTADARERGALVALDAAHIKWHQARGPAEVQNGLALCALHHRLFDAGAFTIASDLTVIAADSISGRGAGEWLWRFAGRPVAADLSPATKPSPTYLGWHQENVFKGSQVLPL